MSAIIVHTCPPSCALTGGEHAFDTWHDFWRCAECGVEYATPENVARICPGCFNATCHPSGGSMVCACGLTAMDACLLRGDE